MFLFRDGSGLDASYMFLVRSVMGFWMLEGRWFLRYGVDPRHFGYLGLVVLNMELNLWSGVSWKGFSLT